QGHLRSAQGHPGVLPRDVPAEVFRRGGVGVVGLRDLRPQGGPAQEDLHARAAPRHRGPRPPALRGAGDSRRPPEEPRQAERRRLTMPDEIWHRAFLDYSNVSFSELLRLTSPSLLPGPSDGRPEDDAIPPVPHGTTVLALRYRDGVIMAG